MMPEDQQVQHFYEELESILAVRRTNIGEEVLYLGFECGEAIVNSPLYKKFSRGQGKFLEDISERFHVKRSTLGNYIKAYEKWGDVEKCRADLQKKLDKPVIFWSEVVKALPAPSAVARIEKVLCKKCKVHGCPNV